MLRFVVRRLLQMIPLLIGITFLSFVVVDLAPGDFFDTLSMNPSISPDLVREMKVEFGYGQPLLVRYGRWLWRVVHLDLGMSIAYRVGVLELIGSRALNTVILAVASMVFTWALAIPIGIIVALRRGTFLDRAAVVPRVLRHVGAELLSRLPADVPGARDRLVSGRRHDVARLPDPRRRSSKLGDRAAHLVLPVIVLGTGGMASLMRLMRSQLLEIQSADYVRTARAKGVPEWLVVVASTSCATR